MALKIHPVIVALIIFLFPLAESGSQHPENIPAEKIKGQYQLVEAVMCERIDNFRPVNQTVVLSVKLENGICYTRFDPVLEKTHIFHKWYRRDLLSSVRELFLEPPRWSTFSSIQLRESDKGPWRVEVTDKDGKILRTLRFSVTD
jgi:hypothetical protein